MGRPLRSLPRWLLGLAIGGCGAGAAAPSPPVGPDAADPAGDAPRDVGGGDGGPDGGGPVDAGADAAPGEPTASAIVWDGQPGAIGAHVLQKAAGCDAFTPAWSADDALYTGFGDCSGLRGSGVKRSIGFGRILGTPALAGAKIDAASITVVDVPTGMSGNADDIGDGLTGPGLDGLGNAGAGKKPASMLAIDGALYVWVRNIVSLGGGEARDAQLKASRNHQAALPTFAWADWKFSDIGFPSFVQYGRDGADSDPHAGGLYVYVLAPDGPNPYRNYDGVVLLRVKRGEIMRRESYEYYASGETPPWTASSARRTRVAAEPAGFGRLSVTYDAPLKKYLMWKTKHGDGTSCTASPDKGGFTVLKAPAPWGPWTELYKTCNFGFAPGESGSFPPKWMSSDGRTVFALFSGGDALSVLRGVIAP